MIQRTFLVLNAVIEIHFVLRAEGLGTGDLSRGWCFFMALVVFPVIMGSQWHSLPKRSQ